MATATMPREAEAKVEVTALRRFTTDEYDEMLRVGILRDYAGRRATAADITLLVEVAVSSLGPDRGEKLAAYAAARIPTYGIINLNTRRVEVYTAPRGAEGVGYTHREDRTEADQFDVILDGQIAVAAILPAPEVASS